MKLTTRILLPAMVMGAFLLNAQPKGPAVWEKDMRHFASQDSIQMPAPGMNLFVGSSSFVKWQTLAQDFPGHRVLNRGFGGSQFPDLIFYADKIIYPYKPAKIFIYEGDNDLAAGRIPEQVLADAKNLREMIAKHLPDVPVVFISLKPSNARWRLKDRYLFVNYQLKLYAAKTPLTEYADVWTPMIGKDGEPLPVFVSDNLHMTQDGYVIWAKVLKPFLK